MKIKFSLDTCTLNYRSPVSISGKLIAYNQFLHVKMTMPIIKDYYFSFLPGFHNSQLNEVEYILKSLFNEDCNLNLSDIQMDKKFFGLLKTDHFISSEVLFFVETILLGVINLKDDSPVKLNDVYSEFNPIEYYQNTKCIKIKINPQTQISKMIDLIKNLQQMNPQMLIRLDGNRKYSLDELNRLLFELKLHLTKKQFSQIDYIEEPFTNFYDSLLFEKRSLIPVAIDESFKEYFKFNTTSPLSTSINIIKPSLYGISPIINWMNLHADLRCIISSTYEHPTVMPSLSYLARMRPLEYHGLENFFNTINN